MASKAGKAQLKTEAECQLRRWLHPGDTVYTVLRSRARSGMSRTIDLYTIKDGDLLYLSGYVANYMQTWPRTDDGALRVGGCGMDAGYAVVHELSASLFRNVDGSYSHDGAYALKHEWI